MVGVCFAISSNVDFINKTFLISLFVLFPLYHAETVNRTTCGVCERAVHSPPKGEINVKKKLLHRNQIAFFTVTSPFCSTYCDTVHILNNL